MFFILSKTLVFLTAPSNLLITLAIVGTVLLFTRFVRLGRCLLVVGMLGIVVLGVSPLGKILLSVLENRFPTWSATQGAPTGFIILGGSVDPGTSAAHGEVELTDSAERLAVVPDLQSDVAAIRRVPRLDGPGARLTASSRGTQQTFEFG